MSGDEKDDQGDDYILNVPRRTCYRFHRKVATAKVAYLRRMDIFGPRPSGRGARGRASFPAGQQSPTGSGAEGRHDLLGEASHRLEDLVLLQVSELVNYGTI